MSSTLYQFTGERLGAIDWCDPVRGHTLVADSWRVDNAQAVALPRHEARFGASARAFDIDESTLTSFFTQVRAHIPRSGSWFPRIELAHTPGGPTLRYRERVAPAWSEEVVLAVAENDPRSNPLTKGPDLEALLALRASVGSRGATEALIVASDGTLVEGAYSTLMVWPDDADALVVVPHDVPRIPSITESVLVDHAKVLGIDVLERRLRLDDLESAEVWVVSALHGIRLATSVIDGPELRRDPDRRTEWQRAWWGAARSIDSSGA
jgi:branched-subunit amino acid aminotransferase/4-amino-4-deoxychorismate lyase